nr:FeoA family protein [Blautia coccoides]
MTMDNEGVMNMPLTMASTGETKQIKKVGGREEIRRHLENLGFVTGTDVTVVSQLGGNVIVSVKDSRIAISSEMANRIMV